MATDVYMCSYVNIHEPFDGYYWLWYISVKKLSSYLIPSDKTHDLLNTRSRCFYSHSSNLKCKLNNCILWGCLMKNWSFCSGLGIFYVYRIFHNLPMAIKVTGNISY